MEGTECLALSKLPDAQKIRSPDSGCERALALMVALSARLLPKAKSRDESLLWALWQTEVDRDFLHFECPAVYPDSIALM
jgi:hypothetical protein